MSAPQVIQVVPDVNDTDVVLGQALVVTFDQAIDPATLNDSTFSLTYPSPTQIVTSGQLISGASSPSTVSVEGVWSFATNDQGCTVASFQEKTALPPNTLITAQLLGSDASLSDDEVKNMAGEPMELSYAWSFTTGALNLTVPPPTSPLIDAQPAIPVSQIIILPRASNIINRDLTQQIDIVFPGDIDPESFDLEDLLLSIEPVLGDPSIPIPANLTYQCEVHRNKLRIAVYGLPN